jgi:hypothetical protein
VLKSRQLRGREREYLVKWKGYHPIEVMGEWVRYGACPRSHRRIPQ